jgi:twitching motility protein PilT
VFRQRGSVGLAVRRVRSEIPTIEELLLPDVMATLADAPRGLVLVTGPTGTGKTTTIAAMIGHINRTRRTHIITI